MKNRKYKKTVAALIIIIAVAFSVCVGLLLAKSGILPNTIEESTSVTESIFIT